MEERSEHESRVRRATVIEASTHVMVPAHLPLPPPPRLERCSR